jgi:hypothetical protein
MRALGLAGLLTLAFPFTLPRAKADDSWNLFGGKKKSHPARGVRGDSAREEFIASIGTGLPIVSGDLGWAFDMVGAYRVSSQVPIFFGLDVGYYHLSKKFLLSDITLGVVRIAATGVYRHAVGPKTTLYGGVSVGPAFASPAYDILKLDSATKLAFLLRPGAEFVLNEVFSLSAELRMGITPDLSLNLDRFGRTIIAASAVGSGFMLYPMVNAVFRF